MPIPPTSPAPRPTQAAFWGGCALSGLTTLVLAADAAIHLLAPERIRPLMEASGFVTDHASRLGLVILVCAVLYAVPRTAFLGAILVTGFLGGAICAHFRLGEIGSPPQLIALAIGVMAWGGLYLRDPRLRDLLPFRAASGEPKESRTVPLANRPAAAA